jgi:hypothetical protein
MKPSAIQRVTEASKLDRHTSSVSGSSRASISGINPLDAAMEPFKDGTFASTVEYIESISRKIVLHQQHQASVGNNGTSRALSSSAGAAPASARLKSAVNTSSSTGSVATGGQTWFEKAAGPTEIQNDDSMFDSTPYEEVFESTLANLTMLRQHVEGKISVLAKDCTVLEKEYKTKLEGIQRKFDRLFKEFKTFDTTINKVSTSAQRIGGSLESVEAQRNRAIETKIFLEYLVLLNDDQAKPAKVFGDTTDLDNAILLKNLLILAAELDMPMTIVAKTNIEKMAEQLEQTQRDRFSRAAQEKKYQTMESCARTLFELNGGEECIKAYIGQLPMFYEDDMEDLEDRVAKPVDTRSVLSPSSSGASLPGSSEVDSTGSPSPTSSPPSSLIINRGINFKESSMAKSASSSKESKTELAFNPNYPHARKRILKPNEVSNEEPVEPNFIRIDRFYEKIVLSIRAECDVIAKVFPVPPLVLMRLTQRVFELRISSFIDNLIENCAGSSLESLERRLRTLTYAVEHMDQVVKDLNAAPTSLPEPALQTFANAVFVKHREDFIKYQVQSMQLALVKEQEVEDDSPAAVQARAAGKKTPFKPIDLDVDLTIRCLECAESAASRCSLLSHPKMLAENMYKIFQTLIREFGRNIMLVVLDQNIRKLSNAQSGATNPLISPPLLVASFFNIVQTINTNVVLLQKHYFVKIRPFIEGSRNEQTLCQSEKNKLLQLLEDSIEIGLDKALFVLLGEIDNMLMAKQRRRNWKPKPNEVDQIDFQHASDACLSVCAFIKSQHSLLSDALDGRNLQAFLIELGTRVLASLLKHIKKFEVDQGIGAFCLMRDMSEYQECIASFKIERLNTDFEILKSIAKLHMVGPEQLGDVISDSPLSKWPKSELELFIKMRSDYDRTWLGKYF